MTIRYFLQQSKPIVNHFSKLVGIGYDSYNEIIDKDKIALMIMKELGNDVYDVLADTNALSKFNNYLISASKSDAVDFAEEIKGTILNRYQDDLVELFSDIKHEYRRAS